MVGAAIGGQLRPSAAIRERRRKAAQQNHNFLFIHIPKTAGTSIRTALGMWALPYHITAAEARVVHPDSIDKFSFAFVRNPWDRLVSYGQTMYIGMDWDSPTRFDRLDLRPQVEFILDEDGKPLVDFIGRFENLEEDFDTVCQRIGIPTPQLPHLNGFAHHHYRQYYNEQERQIVAEKYADDIARFGYTF